MNILLSKLKEVLSAVAPIVIFVVILSFTLAPVPGIALFRFIIGALAMVFGLSILLFGIELSVLPFGNYMSKLFVKSNNIWYIIIVSFLLGFFINIAEPDLQVLAAQVASVMGGYIPAAVILVAVSIGTGVMLSLGVTRIVKKIPLHLMLTVIYGAIFLLAVFSSSDMLAIGFDASGATTGALTVPLVLSLSVGVAAIERDRKASGEDSFGLVGIMSAGAILGILILNLFVKTDHVTGVLISYSSDTVSLMSPFFAELPEVAAESLIALLPIALMLLIFNKISFRLKTKSLNKMLFGFLYTFIGLIIFLVGVKAGFMNVGNMIGHSLASYDNKAILVGFGFILGMLVILTEPAVYILTQQIESVTSGYIKKKTVLITLSIGVAFAVGLAMLRIVIPSIALWHYLLPGFIISLVLTFIVPKIFVGIAFDSGGVASGPMTATFVLAFAQGASDATAHSNILVDSFGVIAMVAMTPLIALQVLGLIYKLKSRKGEDEQTMAGYHLIYCVVNIGDGSKTLKYAKKYGVKGATISMCRGTANSRLLEFFGVSDIQKVIIKMIVEKELASEAIKGISKNMAFDKPHHGIAFSYSISEFIGSAKIVINSMNTEEVKKSMYKAIHVIVDKGNAEDVIEAANQAGARGGTIINARRSGINEIHKLFSIEIEPEKEEVLIITKSAFKDAIVEAIKNHLNIDEPGNGIMFILNINEAYGLS